MDTVTLDMVKAAKERLNGVAQHTAIMQSTAVVLAVIAMYF